MISFNTYRYSGVFKVPFECDEILVEVLLTRGAADILDTYLSSYENIEIKREDLIREAIEVYLAFLVEKRLN